MSGPSATARKKQPQQLAVINADRCTGCEACIEVCPVDCIHKVGRYSQAPNVQTFCEIDWDRCIGCKLCIRIPTKRSDGYALLVCPWDAITMVPVAQLLDAVAKIGGPIGYVLEHTERLKEVARRQVHKRRLASG